MNNNFILTKHAENRFNERCENTSLQDEIKSLRSLKISLLPKFMFTHSFMKYKNKPNMYYFVSKNDNYFICSFEKQPDNSFLYVVITIVNKKHSIIEQKILDNKRTKSEQLDLNFKHFINSTFFIEEYKDINLSDHYSSDLMVNLYLTIILKHTHNIRKCRFYSLQKKFDFLFNEIKSLRTVLNSDVRNIFFKILRYKGNINISKNSEEFQFFLNFNKIIITHYSKILAETSFELTDDENYKLSNYIRYELLIKNYFNYIDDSRKMTLLNTVIKKEEKYFILFMNGDFNINIKELYRKESMLNHLLKFLQLEENQKDSISKIKSVYQKCVSIMSKYNKTDFSFDKSL